jgi:HEPN domain-containing protein
MSVFGHPVNPEANKLLRAAAHDYASARCLLLNGLVPGGLAAGAQAIEKFLKAYILLQNPERHLGGLRHHRLAALLSEADQLSPKLQLSKYTPQMDRFEKYYLSRYPDNEVVLAGMSSAEIVPLDEFTIHLNENMLLPLEIKLRTGLYAVITSSLHLEVMPPWEHWIRYRNYALEPLLPRIEMEFRTTVQKNQIGE